MNNISKSQRGDAPFLKAYVLAVLAVFVLSYSSGAAQEYGAIKGKIEYQTLRYGPDEAGDFLDSYATYEYDSSSRLTKTSIFSADGSLQWYMAHKWKEIKKE